MICLCGEAIDPKRVGHGYHTCLKCGELEAKKVRHTIVPMHKSNYVPVFNRSDLVGINVKSGKL